MAKEPSWQSNTIPAPTADPPALKILPGNSDKFKLIVLQVQSALYRFGYYTVPLDGVVQNDTREAISKLQRDYKLAVTGTITPELLSALKIPGL